MRYELYGVGPDGGDIQHVFAGRSFTEALHGVESLLDSEEHPDFLILEKVAENQAPVSCSFGHTANGYVHRQTSFVLGFNPAQSALDFQAYRDGWNMKAVESHDAYQRRKDDYKAFLEDFAGTE